MIISNLCTLITCKPSKHETYDSKPNHGCDSKSYHFKQLVLKALNHNRRNTKLTVCVDSYSLDESAARADNKSERCDKREETESIYCCKLYYVHSLLG